MRRLEEAIDATGVPAVHLRAGSFMENLRPDIASIKATGTTGGLIPPDLPLPMIATADIGRVAAQFLRGDRDFTPGPVEVAGPAYRTLEEATGLIGAAVGADDARYISPAPRGRAGRAARGGLQPPHGRRDRRHDAGRGAGAHQAAGRGRAITTPTTLEEFLATAIA